MQLGIESLLEDNSHVAQLKGRRVALVANPASVDKKLNHTLEILTNHPDINLVCAFGPQHGVMGDKQYNMEETPHTVDKKYNIPIYSLYSETRRPTDEMLKEVDVVLFDLQDVGCRIYTYVATLVYMMEACERLDKTLWVLDRPNPIGRKIEGSYLKPDWKSFVGEVELPMRHGLTLGELAHWYKDKHQLKLDFKVIEMKNYNPKQEGQWGWDSQLAWVNPSPQLPSLRSCRPYCGTVLLEATDFSEGRGMTSPLEVVGAPNFPAEKIINELTQNYTSWVKGCGLRISHFTPTFNKHAGQLCSAIQIHTDNSLYDYDVFTPYRLMAGFFKSIKKVTEVESIWASFHYEYEKERLPIDLLTGCEFFKNWVDDEGSSTKDLDHFLSTDEGQWHEERKNFLLY